MLSAEDPVRLLHLVVFVSGLINKAYVLFNFTVDEIFDRVKNFVQIFLKGPVSMLKPDAASEKLLTGIYETSNGAWWGFPEGEFKVKARTLN